jgi:hypothetical protein
MSKKNVKFEPFDLYTFAKDFRLLIATDQLATHLQLLQKYFEDYITVEMAQALHIELECDTDLITDDSKTAYIKFDIKRAAKTLLTSHLLLNMELSFPDIAAQVTDQSQESMQQLIQLVRK